MYSLIFIFYFLGRCLIVQENAAVVKRLLEEVHLLNPQFQAGQIRGMQIHSIAWEHAIMTKNVAECLAFI